MCLGERRQLRDRVEARSVGVGRSDLIGGPAGVVVPAVERLMEATGAEELMASTSTYDREALAQMDAELSALLL